jgi:hypothetical protein
MTLAQAFAVTIEGVQLRRKARRCSLRFCSTSFPAPEAPPSCYNSHKVRNFASKTDRVSHDAPLGMVNRQIRP